MYQELLKQWIKTIPCKENRKNLGDKQELKVFAEWLDENIAKQSTLATGICPFCGELISSEFHGIHQFCYPAESPSR